MRARTYSTGMSIATLVPPSYPALESEVYAALNAPAELEEAAEDYLRAADDLTRRGLFAEAAELLQWHSRTVRVAALGALPAPRAKPWVEIEVDVLFADLCSLDAELAA